MIPKIGYSTRSYQTLLVVGITLLASLFSFLNLGQKNIWIDEGISIAIAKMSWGDFWALLSGVEINMWFYFLLLKVWILFGDTEFAVRSLSALFAIASIPVLYAFTKRLFGDRAALITILYTSVNAYLIEYAQEARGYALVFFLVILSSYLFVRLTEDPPDKKMMSGYVIFTVLAVYTHIFAGLILLVQTSSILFLPADKTRTRRVLFANLLIAVLLCPLAYFVLTIGGGQISWIPEPSISQFKELIMDLSGDAGRVRYIPMILLIPCLVTLAHAFTTFFKTGRSYGTWRYVFVISWLIVPISLSFAISFIKPMFLSRYLIVSLPGLMLLAGIGTSLIEDKYCLVILSLLIIVLSIRSTVTQYYPKEKEENNKEATFYVVSHAQKGDGILFYRDGAMISFEYYMKRLNPPKELLDSIYPARFGHFKYGNPPGLTVSYLNSLKDRYERIWVVLRQNGISFQFIPYTLKKYYHLQQAKKYTGIDVLLFIRK